MSIRNCKKIIIFIFCAGLGLPAFFAQSISLKDTIDWGLPIKYGLEGQEKKQCLFFEDAQYNYEENPLPFIYKKLNLPIGGVANSIFIKDVKYEKLTPQEDLLIQSVKNEIPNQIHYIVEKGVVRKIPVSYLKLYPLVRLSSGEIRKVVSIELEVFYEERSNLFTADRKENSHKALKFANQSVLSSGEWYKIATVKRGVYKITPDFLEKMGIDTRTIDPRNIKLFGYGNGMLPIKNNVERPDDLIENAIYVKGETDGRLDEGDFIAFYGEGQVVWSFDTVKNVFNHLLHHYSDTVFYYLNIGSTPGKRIQKATPLTSANQEVTTFDDYDFYEIDKVNLLKSGALWLGETFENQLSYNFSFNFPDIDKTSKVNVEVKVVARSGVQSKFTVSSQGNSSDVLVEEVAVNRFDATYARSGIGRLSFLSNSSVVNLNMTYNKPQAISKGWLDYITVNARRKLVYHNAPLFFRDTKSVGANRINEFKIQTNNDLKVWDLTDRYNAVELSTSRNGNQLSFVNKAEELREYVAFNDYDSTNIFIKGKVPNQNLHAYPQADLLIVTHPMFLSQAEELGNFHEREGLKVHVVTTTEVYNEFSSGSQDPIAIRSFAKMFYDKGDKLQYLLLFGDASYDFKDRISGNTNFVVSYQSPNSFDPVGSYVSDDYMALLDDHEGAWSEDRNNLDKIDLGVGRLPVKSIEEANAVVSKIKNYYRESNMGDWQNKMVFVADDGDNALHMSQADNLAYQLGQSNKEYNVEKVYLGAYQKQFTPAGPRIPEANKRIDQAVINGALLVNYVGHGGETGWAEERVLDIRTINAWNNFQQMPVFMTATCEFSRFDDPLRTSAGELVLLNPRGGGIALLSTTRLVYANQNFLLNKSFINRLMERNPDGNYKRLGQIAMEVKNDNAGQLNTRNFSLLGDPALKLAIPNYTIVTSGVYRNDSLPLDTARALSKVTVEGYIMDRNGPLHDFNGTLHATVYDKPKSVQASGNFTFNSQEARIFKGKASVSNGKFNFSFIVPKDIDYDYGNGKISYFAEDGLKSGSGVYDSLLIGGSSDDMDKDKEGPNISLYLNDRTFVYGGITDNQPVLIADLEDASGINTVGNGVGHDLIAILNDDTENTMVLNDFYEANKDDFTSGQIRFPLEKLSEGKHKLTIKAWDVANNSSEQTIEFVVQEDKEIKIGELVNYPNPFTTNTEFIFQHNQAGIPLRVKIEIFTISGKLVKSIDQTIVSQGYLVRDIKWDGRDDYGNRIGKGVYVYRLKIRSDNGSMAEKIEKLVII